MPKEGGQGSTSRATTKRSAVTGRYVRAKSATATGLRIRVWDGKSKTETQRRHRDKSAVTYVFDKHGHSASSTIITTTHRARRVAPEAQTGRDAQADSSVEQYANLVLGPSEPSSAHAWAPLRPPISTSNPWERQKTSPNGLPARCRPATPLTTSSDLSTMPTALHAAPASPPPTS